MEVRGGHVGERLLLVIEELLVLAEDLSEASFFLPLGEVFIQFLYPVAPEVYSVNPLGSYVLHYMPAAIYLVVFVLLA